MKMPSTEIEKSNSLPKGVIFKNRYYARKLKVKGEKYTLPSLTQPAQALSLKSLLDRFARTGEIMSNGNEAYYGEDIPIGELQNMDKFERLDLLKNNREYIAQLQSELSSLNATAQSAGTEERGSKAAEGAKPTSAEEKTNQENNGSI